MRVAAAALCWCAWSGCGDNHTQSPTADSGSAGPDARVPLTPDASTSAPDATAEPACGVEPDPDDPAPPTVEIVFPPPGAMTDADAVIVRGTAFDPDGLASIRVNGILATTNDGFNNFTAEVALVEGANEIVIESEDTGRVITREAGCSHVLRRGPRLSVARDMIWDSTNQRALVRSRLSSSVLVALDSTSWRTDLVSGYFRGDGTPLIRDLQLGWDPVNEQILVVSTGADGDGHTDIVYAVDAETGDRQILVVNDSGDGPALDHVVSVIWDPVRQRALLLNSQELLSMDAVTGSRTLVSSATQGTGPMWVNPQSITWDATNERALIAAHSPNGIHAIDIATGDRNIVSGDGIGSGPDFVAVREIRWDQVHGRALVLDRGAHALFAVDVTTGARSILADGEPGGALAHLGTLYTFAWDPLNLQMLVVNPDDTTVTRIASDGSEFSIHNTDERTGQGPYLVEPWAATLDRDRNRVLVTDWETDRLNIIDRDTGDRDTLAEALGQPRSVEWDSDNGRAYVASAAPARITAVDGDTGDTTILAEAGAGSGFPFESAHALTWEPQRARILYVDWDQQAVLALDPATLQRKVITANDTHPGPLLALVRDLAWDSGDKRVLIADRWGIYTIDDDTGERAVLSRSDVGQGPLFGNPWAIACDASGDRIVMLDGADGALIAIDEQTGDRTLVSGVSGDRQRAGRGPFFWQARGLDVDWTRELAYVIDWNIAAVLVVDMVTGERVTLSR